VNVLKPLNRLSSSRARLLGGLAAPLAAALMMALPTTSYAGFFLSVNVAPPPIPVYEQPVMPGDGYMWAPGYWAYSDNGYFWVPGTWVQPPAVGLLWTPGYWGWGGGYYAFHSGYWGPHIGFYGGVNYGFGYGGVGFYGGYWNHGGYYYNRGYNNFGGVHVANVYDRTVVNNNISHVSFNGGTGGIRTTASKEEMLAARDHHVQPVADQQRQVEMASQNKAMFASENHGAPAVAGTSKAGEFSGAGVVAAHPVSAEDKAAVDSAVAAKPIGKPVGSAAEMSSHSMTHASAMASTAHTAHVSSSHVSSSHMASSHMASSHGPSQSSNEMRRPPSRVPVQGPHPMAQQHPMGAPHPMAQPRPAQHAPPPQKDKNHH